MLLALLALIPLAAAADHRPEFQSLIDEPANMLDIAMLRLQDFIIWTKPHMAFTYQNAVETDKHTDIDINAHYYADEGMIHVSASIRDAQSTREQTEVGCRNVLIALRINLNKNNFFSHIDGSFRPSANGQRANQADMIKLRCHVNGSGLTDPQFSGAMSLHFDAEMEILPVD
jgi:hypothetical protein